MSIRLIKSFSIRKEKNRQNCKKKPSVLMVFLKMLNLDFQFYINVESIYRSLKFLFLDPTL